jgi:hypothetical protein
VRPQYWWSPLPSQLDGHEHDKPADLDGRPAGREAAAQPMARPTAQPHEKLAPTPRGAGLTVDVDRVRSMTAMEQAQAGPAVVPGSGGVAPQGVELRHLRYFVAVADAGT